MRIGDGNTLSSVVCLSKLTPGDTFLYDYEDAFEDLNLLANSIDENGLLLTVGLSTGLVIWAEPSDKVRVVPAKVIPE